MTVSLLSEKAGFVRSDIHFGRETDARIFSKFWSSLSPPPDLLPLLEADRNGHYILRS